MFVDQGAEFYTPDGPRNWSARYKLWRAWDWVGPTAVVCGANPSLANADRLDPTMHSIIRLLRETHGGYFMVNAEPIVDPSPAGADRWHRMMRADHPEEYAAVRDGNFSAIKEVVADAHTVIVAWGNLVPSPDARLIEALTSAGHAVQCWGRNLNGSPKHPLARGRNRIPTGAPLVPWRV